jgi:NhaP-type Na+/H+ or K+/H+ antiporter
MKLDKGQVFVLLMAVESLGAAVAYALARNWKLAAYWLFAACITAVTSTF